MKKIDWHCDTASLIYEKEDSLFCNTHHVDIKKLHEAGYSAQWFAFFIHLKTLEGKAPMAVLESMYQYFLTQVQINKEHIQIVTNYAGYKKCLAEGKISAFLSLEEGQVIEKNLDNLKRLEEMGIRLMTLTWNFPNDLGYPHTINEGLTPFGREVVDYLNNSPILIDVSHLSDKGFNDVVTYYKKPIIASHSNGRGFHEHTRNLSDWAIKEIAKSGGIIGTNFYSYFLANTNKTTCEMIRDNILYVYKVGGEDVLALGTDFDGIDCELEVCNSKKMAILVDSIYKVLPSRVVDKLFYGNAERVIKENL